MDNPNTHYFHVRMLVNELSGDNAELKLPNWTPGYYWIMDYAKHIASFKAKDKDGKPLEWEKTNKNTWKIYKPGLKDIVIEYDVYSYNLSVADPYLDYGRAFISPTGVFMHLAGQLDLPSTVKIIPYKEWESVCTGLNPADDSGNVFHAPNFDVLYDSPILAGNLEIIQFEIDTIPYYVAVEKPGNTYLGNAIRAYERVPGSKYQSATESSFDTWINFFNRSSNSANATISYYDKGCALGMLIDLAIR